MNGKTNSANNISDRRKAILEIVSETGSTVDLSKDGVVLCSFSPNKTNYDDNTKSNYYYYVDESNYGEFHIETTANNVTTEADVTVNSNKLYVAKSIRFYLYKNGSFMNTSVTGGFTALARRLDKQYAAAKAPSISYYDDHFYYYLSKGGGTFQTNNMIDLTPYKTLKCIWNNVDGNVGQIRMFVDNNSNYMSAWDTTNLALTHLNGDVGSGKKATWVLDISEINVSARICFGSSWANGTIYGDIYSIWLE